ncbi:MAG: response regulator transcription factor [Chloroflexota bacterium]|nr:response regulator transcription factor [Chloroflexota bacterium]
MRALIADDHSLVRRALRSLLKEYGHEVVGEAHNGLEAVEVARAIRPEVVLMDLSMPDMTSLTAIRLISAEMPEIKVIVLTASEDDEGVLEAVKFGASGYFNKNIESDEFFDLLEAVISGEPALPAKLAPRVLDEFAHVDEGGPPHEELTPRERDVLELMAEGITSDRDLAERLFVSENTVKYHLKNVFGKLHTRNRAQVVAYAFRYGLVGEEPSPPT